MLALFFGRPQRRIGRAPEAGSRIDRPRRRRPWVGRQPAAGDREPCRLWIVLAIVVRTPARFN